MRYYTENELMEVIDNFEKYWKASFKGDKLPDITLDELKEVALADNKNKKKAVFYTDFEKSYQLNIGDYFDDKNRAVVGANDINSEESKRFPIIVLYNNDKDPDMFTLAEYHTLYDERKNEDFKVIVLDKMTKPMDKEYLDTIAKQERITYDYNFYA